MKSSIVEHDRIAAYEQQIQRVKRHEKICAVIHENLHSPREIEKGEKAPGNACHVGSGFPCRVRFDRQKYYIVASPMRTLSMNEKRENNLLHFVLHFFDCTTYVAIYIKTP